MSSTTTDNAADAAFTLANNSNTKYCLIRKKRCQAAMI